ncbi:MAG: transporter, partial [Betaproteobacteria bacterium]|nr:transporter [Betaproteobacteria bacterium]
MMRSLLSYAVLMIVAGGAYAQTYPARTITVVVPSVAGGPTDLVGRVVAQMLSDNIGQNAVVDNRAGAGNTIGTEYAARAKPDGYTLTIASPSSHSIAPAIYPKLPYNPVRDFTPVILLATAPLLLVTHPSLPVKNVKDLIALAKARPGQLNFGTGGSGTTGHLTAEYFNSVAGIKAVHVPYKGVATASVDLLSGQLQYMFHILNLGSAYVKSKQLRGLAITGRERSKLIPEVPTMSEAGLKGFEVYTWYGVAGPQGMPKDVVDKLYSTLSGALARTENRDRFEKQGLGVVGGKPEELGALIRDETVRWAKV